MIRNTIHIILLVFSITVTFSKTIVIGDLRIDEKIENKDIFHYENYFHLNNSLIPSFCGDNIKPYKLDYSYKYTNEKILSIRSMGQFYFESNFNPKYNRLMINNLMGEVEIKSFNSFISSSIVIDDIVIQNYSAIYYINSLPGTNIFLHVKEGKINIKYKKKSIILLAGESITIELETLHFSDVNDLIMARNMLMYNFYLRYLSIRRQNNTEIKELKQLYQKQQKIIKESISKNTDKKNQKYIYLLKIKKYLIQNIFIESLLNSTLKTAFQKSIQNDYELWKVLTAYTIGHF